MDSHESFGADGQILLHGSDDFISNPALNVSNRKIIPHLQDHHFSGFDDDYNFNFAPQNVSSCGNDELRNDVCVEHIESKKLFPSSQPFEILKKYGRRSRILNGEKLPIICHEKDHTTISSKNQLSIEQIIELASVKFIQSKTSQQNNEISTLSHSYPNSILHQGSEGSVQLIQNLLFSAEKVDEKQYERACQILEKCENMSSCNGSPIERLVSSFIVALYEKIDRETGTISPKGLGEKVEDPVQILKTPNKIPIVFHEKIPLSPIIKFGGIQAIVDSVADAKKVHYIDFEIRNGIQCSILMHALTNKCQRLKITAVGTKSRESIEETGRQLMSFAQTLDLEFSFTVVMVDSFLDLDESVFGIEENESIVVYVAYILNTMITKQDQLEHLMRLVRTINPCVMVVTEIEANCNNPNFVERFVEALFFFGPLIESFAECFKNDGEQRSVGEPTCFRSAIRNIVAADGEERKIRHVGVRVWRAFFTRFEFEEIELSMSSVYQAKLVAKNFACRSSITFDFDGKSLIIGWKGRFTFCMEVAIV